MLFLSDSFDDLGVTTYMAPNTSTKEILAIEKGFWEKGDPAFFQNHFAEGGAAIMEPMGVFDKTQSVKMSSDWKPYHDVQMNDIYTQQIAPNVIAVSYHGEGTREGDNKPYKGRMTSIYVKNDGDWQLSLTVHQTLGDEKKAK